MRAPGLSARRVLRDPVLVLGTGFGAGLAPVAPGTAGTLVGLAAALALRGAPAWLALAAVAAVLAVGVWICGESARRLGTHDHPAIVWDEIGGFLLTALAAPPGLAWMCAAFLLFRLFDIWKPWPIREVDHGLRGGLGIMLDDVIAGVYAAAVLVLLRVVLAQQGA